MTIVLVSLTDPAVRIDLDGVFAESDAEVLLRTFTELRKSKNPDQIPLFITGDAAGDIATAIYAKEEEA